MAARADVIADGMVAWLKARRWSMVFEAEATWATAEDYATGTAPDLRLLVRPDSRPLTRRLIRTAGEKVYVLTLELFQRFNVAEEIVDDAGEVPRQWVSDRAGLLEEIADAIFDDLTGDEALPRQPESLRVYVADEGVVIQDYANLIMQLEYRMFSGVIELTFNEVPG